MQTLDQSLMARGDELWHKCRDAEKLLHFLRVEGISKLGSVKAVRAICQVSLADAKKIVSQSSEWKDTVESTEALHDQVIRAMKSADDD